MDIISKHIHKTALQSTAEKYDMTEKDVSMWLKTYADFVFAHINETDLSKDLSKQYTRFLIRGVGVVHINKVFLLENDYQEGTITEEEYSLAKRWFAGAFKRFDKLLKIYKTIKKGNND